MSNSTNAKLSEDSEVCGLNQNKLSVAQQGYLLSKCDTDAPMLSSAVYPNSTQTKKHLANALQYGRSMIEMLGVLAIIGVLSVGGIAGYTKAMMQYRVNKAIEQVAHISQNVRTFFTSQRNYAGLTSTTADGLKLIKKAKLVPEDMIDENSSIVDDDFQATHHIFNPFGGGAAIWNDQHGNSLSDCGNDDDCLATIRYFQIVYFGLPEEACMALATQDWRSSAMGLTVLEAFKSTFTDLPGEATFECAEWHPNGIVTDDYASACPKGTTVPIPMPLDIAAQACNCPNSDCTIMWGFK